MGTDRFGNTISGELPYARGEILPDTEADFRKLERAWSTIRDRINRYGLDAIFDFSGLERGFPLGENDSVRFLHDEIAPAINIQKFRKLALEHVGGQPDRHDVALLNRTTAGTFATHLALVQRGDTVVGLTPSHTHASVVRAARQVGANFVDTSSIGEFERAITALKRVSLVVLTRLAVTYDLLPVDVLSRGVELAHQAGALVFVDDAGGARVGPACFHQPRMMGLGADIGVTGMDKYGLYGPRLGLLAGERSLVARIRARAFEFGLEARPLFYAVAVRSLERYSPERVHDLVESTKDLARALRTPLGSRLHETAVTAQIRGEDILEIVLERAHLQKPPIVPYEATAALAMLLLEKFGVFTIHLAALPPGTSTLLIKFVPPETVRRFGGSDAFAGAVAECLRILTDLVTNREQLRELLLGPVELTSGV